MINMEIAKNLYYKWLSEQDDFLLWHKAIKYFKNDLWFILQKMSEQGNEQIGQFIKSYMEFANDELKKIQDKRGGI